MVHNFGQVRQHLRYLRAALTMLGKFEAWGQHGGIRLNEGVALSLDYRGRKWFTLELDKFRFVVEQFELAWRADHEQIDHPLGPG